MTNKYEKLGEQIRELAAAFFSKESNRQSLITVTSVEIAARGGRAIVRATILPESAEADAIEFMRRKLTDLRQYVMDNSRIGRVPFFDVELDIGEKNRQHIDDLSNQISQ